MRLTRDDLRIMTLGRQFPAIGGIGPEAVLELFARLGPIQSQVPRAPFVFASSRLPGVSYQTMCRLFEEHRLLKTSNLRGTVHTCVREQFAGTNAIARRGHVAALRRQLKLERITPEAILAEIERRAATSWRSRDDLVADIKHWVAEQESPTAAERIGDAHGEWLVWGHSGLIRRPRDDRWEKRTDIFHRRARSVVADLPAESYEQALARLIRVHLGSYGPATRDDLAFFFHAGLGAVDTAVRALGEQIVRLAGPGRDDYLDLAEPPSPGPDPGTRLLPEYDGLLLGFTGKHRDRFLTAEQLGSVWAQVNGLFQPVVLHEGRIVASWKTVTKGRRTDIEVLMLAPYPALSEDDLSAGVAATETVLALRVTDVRIRPG